ncbi:hypothetical protein J2X02_001356 [Pseudoxanthomonas japonensis]|jgi:hypothetical protein|uniref:hypothetical protein n=1 Tax=Pseudoxanthomonas TaxID=83618 RepID=UPI0012EE5B33|nr:MULTISPECIES: hypothetical protein [Pseudoxanthomonas]MBL8257870.1 hypothetical protein [Pseudoxanthomonas mexicana]MDR7068539.1 hypothetical protein [Pseudoxanthomonas japonensis]
MPTENTVVVIETTGHHMADITLIVHGDDEHSTHHIHQICLDAVRNAIEAASLPERSPRIDNNIGR